MDRIGIQTLKDELSADVAAASAAFEMARQRFAMAGPVGLEATAFHLARLYNIVEQFALRVAKAFENHIDDESGCHSELMRRVSLEISGVRPRLWPAELAAPLRQLRGFRHVGVHSYELALERERLALVMRDAESIVAALKPACEAFIAEVLRRTDEEEAWISVYSVCSVGKNLSVSLVGPRIVLGSAPVQRIEPNPF